MYPLGPTNVDKVIGQKQRCATKTVNTSTANVIAAL